MTDWRDDIIAGLPLRASADGVDAPRSGPGPSVLWAAGMLGEHDVVLVVWDFTAQGGSLGQRDATTYLEATGYAVETGRPVVALVRSGGMRLTEGLAALAGMPRAVIAHKRLADAGVPLISVADQPSTGGVFVSVVSRADVRAAVQGAVLGFAGPRVVESVTGFEPGPGSHTGEAAFRAGLVDAVIAPAKVKEWLIATLDALGGRPELPMGEDLPEPELTDLPPWEQVLAAREPERPSAAQLVDRLVQGGVPLSAPHGDKTVSAVIGRIAGGAAVAVALSAERAIRPTPDGYRLLTRAAKLADRLDLPLVIVVDTPGAEPGPEAENDGIAAAIDEAMQAVLFCRAPTLGVLIGEGGSGGALAGLVCDLVWISPSAYFAVLTPEGAAEVLHTTPEEAAGAMGLRPADVLELGMADGLAPEPDDPTFRARVAEAIAALAEGSDAPRRAARLVRWESGPSQL